MGRWIEAWARRDPARPALLDAERSLDFGALDERIRRCAGVLAARGVRRGERVALLLHNRSAYLEAVFATARLGAIAVPINTRLSAPEIGFQLGDCEPRLLLHEHEAEPRIASSAPASLPRLACGGPADEYEDALRGTGPRDEVDEISPDDPMLLLYTSGTTGRPKGALLPHRKTVANSRNAELFFGLAPRDRALVALPLFHSFGLLILALPTLFAGGSVLLEPRFEAPAVWRDVARYGVTFLGGVPTMFRALLAALDDEPARSADRSSLRFLFSAGAALPVPLVRAFHARGLLLKQGFGQTETSLLCCLDARDALAKAGSVGKPVPHGEVRVVRTADLAGPPEAWTETDPDETGEIVVRGPIVMLGYWRRPEETAETLRGGWLRTGDLARRDAEGFLTLVGRAREMYVSGGENVYPAEVEAALVAHPDVAEAAVVAVPDPHWGERGEAFVVPAAGARIDPEALLLFARQRLAAYKLPRRVHLRRELPRTASGKVRKHELAPASPPPTADEPSSSPSSR